MDGIAESHLYPLSASGWSLWRWVCVRGAGFPANRVLALASPDATNAIDRLLELEVELEAAKARALVAVESDLESRTERAERQTIATHLRRLRAGGVPDGNRGLDWPAAVAVEALKATWSAYQQHRSRCAETLAAERLRLVQVLREEARDPLFREAVLRQNPHALHTGVDALLRQPDTASNAKVRGYERLVASYIQRYCVKNDTISFFGPVGWATIEREGPAIAVQPGSALLAKRTVYFEHWGIDALAVALAEDPGLRRHVAPRRHPHIRVEGTLLHLLDRTTELPREFARLLAACDGQRSARDIALELLQDSELELSGEDEVYELLEELAAQRLAIWTLEIPTNVEHPDRVLESLLEAVQDRAAAAPALAKLAELQAARDAISRAAGDAPALALALARLDETFTRHTGATATRRAGEMYAGRTLVYEDCRRDLAMTIGPAVIERLAKPLSLLLTSARWFTYAVAQRYREALLALHRELELETGSSTIDFLRFWERATELFNVTYRSAPPPLVAAVTEELQRRWTTILGLEGAGYERRQLTASGDQLAAAVGEMFAAPCPGWPEARHHSPDLMIAADSASAIARGEFLLVAGELHLASATVATPWTVRQHPSPEQIVVALERDQSLPTLEPVVPKDNTAGRSSHFSILPFDFDFEHGVTRSRRDRGQVVEAGSLVIERAGDSLQLVSRHGVHTFVLEQFLNSNLTTASQSHFRLLPKVPHCPRITIDGLVVGRESWRFDSAQLDFARVEDPLDRMLAARRWAQTHQLPRFLFYKFLEETKPCYLDLESPHYVELFCYLARKATEVVVTEMLPTVDQTWLPDHRGARYTAELRVVAVDSEPWRRV